MFLCLVVHLCCRLFIRGCGRTSWALKPRRTCWVGSGLSANQQAWRLMTSSTGEPELSIQNRSICRHSVIYFVSLISRSLDAVPVFRTSHGWEITLKPWSSSTQPCFQNETPSLQETWGRVQTEPSLLDQDMMGVKMKTPELRGRHESRSM